MDKVYRPEGFGVLGGTFDPIHFGHLRVAEEIGEILHLRKVFLVPSSLPPHKRYRHVSPFADRLAMTRLAVLNSTMLEVLDLEGRRPGYSYSIQTLRELHEELGDALYFIIGVDAFLEISTWKDYMSLFDYAHFVVMERPGFDLDDMDTILSGLEIDFSPVDLPLEDREGVDDFMLKGGSGHCSQDIPPCINRVLRAPSDKMLILVSPTFMDISSTSIREKVSSRRSIRYLLPDTVIDYIEKKRLYL